MLAVLSVLAATERRSRLLAERFAGLSRCGELDGLNDAAWVQAMLEVGAASLRPQVPIAGYLSHVEGGLVVVDACAFAGPPAGDAFAVLGPGDTLPVHQTLAAQVAAARHAIAWDELTRISLDAVRAKGWGSCIGTSFPVGGSTHLLIFASPMPMSRDPFGDDDRAYVDVLAALFANRLHRRWLSDRMRYAAEHDLLTGLPNRTQFQVALRSAIEAQAPFALAIVDIDGFGEINRAHGHLFGDELLVEVAAELNGIDEADLVARLSADRFGVLMRGAGCDVALTAGLARYERRFARAFSTGDRDGTRTIDVTASFGVAVFPHDGQGAEDLARRADIALEAGKSRGAGTVRRYDAAMEQAFQRGRISRADLLRAVQTEELHLVYQPTFELESRRLAGAEALIRWNHPQHGLLAPSEFIPFAERAGIIGRVTSWVIDEVLRDLGRMPHLPAEFRCYVNISAKDLADEAFVDQLRRALEHRPGLTRNLGIEVTESAAMEDLSRSADALSQLRALGVAVALDDFGTGHSSLPYLRRLPFDILKIDRTFVHEQPSNGRDAAVGEMLCSLGRRLGVATLAEGIEREAQIAWALAHGCRYGQGFHLAPPQPFDDLRERLLREV
ncbi:MAG TPA: bifunctional diguanylate cyclase/phosphodiesterase [Candidatus Sulfotelmatobacter sp.]|nr:bifunctional diguanylate cyclase/phosphodiesterase [Candidatus Sulfotelmatobacter sp.]